MQAKTINLTLLAQAYGVNIATLKKWIQPFQEEIKYRNHQRIFTPKQVSIIFEKLGMPDQITILVTPEILEQIKNQ